MDVAGATPYGAILQGASAVLNAVKPVVPPAPDQRADGYSMGGMSDGTSSGGATGGATGGAYGGAWSQSFVDGSNWVVSLGKGVATNTGKSGDNGGFSPAQTNQGGGGVNPQSPFSFQSPLASVGSSSGLMPMILVGLAVFLFMRR
jgi:hypothetical protein